MTDGNVRDSRVLSVDAGQTEIVIRIDGPLVTEGDWSEDEDESEGFCLDVRQIKPDAAVRVQSYIFAYGFRKILQDSVSGVLAKAKTSWGKPADDKDWLKFSQSLTAEEIAECEAGGITDPAQAFADAVVTKLKAKKLEALINGTATNGRTGTRGPRLQGFARFLREEAVETLLDYCKRNKIAVPTGDERLEYLKALEADESVIANAREREAKTKDLGSKLGGLLAGLKKG